MAWLCRCCGMLYGMCTVVPVHLQQGRHRQSSTDSVLLPRLFTHDEAQAIIRCMRRNLSKAVHKCCCVLCCVVLCCGLFVCSAALARHYQRQHNTSPPTTKRQTSARHKVKVRLAKHTHTHTHRCLWTEAPVPHAYLGCKRLPFSAEQVVKSIVFVMEELNVAGITVALINID